MERNWWRRGAKTLVGIAAGVTALSAVDAKALQFNTGDLMLALYANGQEYYRNLGPASTVLAGPFSVDISTSSLNPLSVTAGAEPVRWSLLSTQGTTQFNTFINTASQFTSAEINAAGTNQGIVAVNSNMAGWRNALGLATGPGTEAVLAASNPASFSSNFGVGGTLGGNFTGAGQQGLFDETLTIVMGQARVGTEFNLLSDVGRAVLASNGLLTITPVPIPAAVILFGTGLIGLAGIARRGRAKLST